LGIVFSLFLSILLSLCHPAKAEDGKSPKTIGETFLGEELHYEIDFWIIKGIADVVLSFSRDSEKGRYVITLKGKTKGIIGYALRQREDYYRAVSEEIDGGRKLRTVYYEEYVKIGSKTRKNIHFFDHEKRRWIHKYYKDGRERRETVKEIPNNADYNDFLTAAYNFRYGVYGDIRGGGIYKVPVFPRRGIAHYEVKVSSYEGSQSFCEKAFFVELKVDPELINSSQGIIEGLLSHDLYPVEGVIRDVVFFGDVKGRLKRRIKTS
jgi:hypothetical protein